MIQKVVSTRVLALEFFMTPRRFTSMAEKRRFERQQDEIERIRKAKVMGSKAPSRDDEGSKDETPKDESR